jgi:CrcB protein
VSLEARCGAAASRTLLLLSTGFLGSFSTFSTWMAELLMTLRQRHVGEALLLCGGSLLGGLLAVGAGLALGSS